MPDNRPSVIKSHTSEPYAAGQTGAGQTLRHDFSLSAVLAGCVAVLIGYSSSAAIIFQAAAAAGADQAQIGSWMWALGIGMGLTSLGLSWCHRTPLLTAWSTPGAALLITQLPGVPFEQALGAFVVCSLLLMIVGVSDLMTRLMNAVPASLAAAMLAGILLPFGLDIFLAMEAEPLLPLTLLACWIAARRWLPSLAIPLVLIAGLALSLVSGQLDTSHIELALTTPQWTTPEFSLNVCLGVGVPLFLVTMATQNLPGVAIIRTAGFQPPVGSALRWTGIASLLMAPFGGHGINLAAISAAPCVGEESHPDLRRRYIAGMSAGVVYLVLGLLGSTVTALFTALPDTLVMSFAGLALMGTLGGGLRSAFQGDTDLDAPLVTFLITASSITLLGIGSAFWGLIAGLVVHLIRKSRP
ncbi:benzoate/H(+) symporter BenE family transporter [Halomonas huangheensis]|nr:benzoate/H(+) symporter BenE family transporter [Halomonas huangheensis]